MKHFLLFLLFILFISCSQEKKKEEFNFPITKIKINPVDDQKAYIEDIADSIYYVSLKAEKDFSIKHISNFFVTDSLIIIADRSQSTVFLFDKEGKPKIKINHLGDQPGDYANLTNIIYDEYQHRIELLDLSLNKIFRYDLNGKSAGILDIVGSRYFGLTFAKTKDMYVSEILNNNKNLRRLRLYKERDGMLTYHSQELFFPPLIKELDLGFSHQFDNYKDTVYYYPLLDNKIYTVNIDEVKPVFQIEVPSKNQIGFEINSAKPAKDHFDYWKKMESAEVMYDNNSLFVTDNWVSFRYNFKSKADPRNAFFSKKTGKTLQFTELCSKKDPMLHSRNKISGKLGDYFVTIVPFKNEAIPQSKPATDNHIVFKLMYFRLKENQQLRNYESE
ncbi:6-bladed beta-propeller [Pedobacter ginsengisoli]|nr:6-bladed beta-propeller [Pedobacter ginsengisoli]